MKPFLTLILLLLIGVNSSFSQNLERKLIVENGLFYYVSVDENMQIATLYKGSVNDKLAMATAYAVPAGRGISAQPNPLAWDVRNEEMMAVNFMDHSLNDRNEAIKRFKLSALRKWGPAVQLEEVVMESIDQHTFMLNEPYLFVKERSKFLNHFYFDGIMVGDSYWMVCTNNGELTIWEYADASWKRSEVREFPVNGAFNLVGLDDKIYLWTLEGAVYQINLSTFKSSALVQATRNLNDVIMIENRDQKKIFSLQRAAFNFEKTLAELMLNQASELVLN